MVIASPKILKRTKSFFLTAEWQDGFRATVSLEKFREECPCAQCREDREKTDATGIKFGVLKVFDEGMNELKEIKKVGNYAISPVWGDGHDIGLYDWAYLRELFEKNALSDDEITELENKYSQ